MSVIKEVVETENNHTHVEKIKELPVYLLGERFFPKNFSLLKNSKFFESVNKDGIIDIFKQK
jgi:hypothetical protein